MEHIIQFGVTIDDDLIQKRIIERAEKTITEEFKGNIEKSIFDRRDVCYGKSRTELSIVGKEIISDWLKDNSERIIEIAANQVAEKVFRSKARKEKYGEVTADDNS